MLVMIEYEVCKEQMLVHAACCNPCITAVTVVLQIAAVLHAVIMPENRS